MRVQQLFWTSCLPNRYFTQVSLYSLGCLAVIDSVVYIYILNFNLHTININYMELKFNF